MKNYRNNIVNAFDQSEKMKLHSDFDKNMKIIKSYPILVQYIKLIEITEDCFDVIYQNTKNIEIKEMAERFKSAFLSDIKAYLKNGNDNRLKAPVEQLIESLSFIASILNKKGVKY